MFDEGEAHSVLLDNANSQPIQPLEVCSSEGRKLEPTDCHLFIY